MEPVKAKRQVNFELLRILCMYMIVIGHCLFHGRVTAKLGYGTVNYFLSYFVQSFSVVHVNCFVMIGGYFAVGSTFRSERVLRFWRQVSFYALLIFALYGFLASVSPGDAVKALFPISAYNYWFASVYMGLLLLTPFISMLAMRLTKAQYRWLLVCLAIFFSVNQMIFQVNAYGSYSGRELPWFIFLALLAGYIRLHTRQERKYFYYGLAGYILSSLAILASVYLSVELGLDEIGYFLNYNSPLALLSTACLFLAVKNMPWKETRVDGLIRKIASAAFGVYLIHDNYLIRYLVWDTFRASKVALTHWAVIYAAAVAVVVYVACTCIELLRQKLFAACGERYEKTSLYQKEQALCRRIDRIFTKTPA